MSLVTALLASTVAQTVPLYAGTCDCSQNLGNCSITGAVNQENTVLTLFGPANQCVHVIYYVGGRRYPYTFKDFATIHINKDDDVTFDD